MDPRHNRSITALLTVSDSPTLLKRASKSKSFLGNHLHAKSVNCIRWLGQKPQALQPSVGISPGASDERELRSPRVVRLRFRRLAVLTPLSPFWASLPVLL